MRRIGIACLVASAALLSCKTGKKPQTEMAPPKGNILIADFEGSNYGGWKATGTAFGKRPARANVSPRSKVTRRYAKAEWDKKVEAVGRLPRLLGDADGSSRQ